MSRAAFIAVATLAFAVAFATTGSLARNNAQQKGTVSVKVCDVSRNWNWSMMGDCSTNCTTYSVPSGSCFNDPTDNDMSSTLKCASFEHCATAALYDGSNCDTTELHVSKAVAFGWCHPTWGITTYVNSTHYRVAAQCDANCTACNVTETLAFGVCHNMQRVSRILSVPQSDCVGVLRAGYHGQQCPKDSPRHDNDWFLNNDCSSTNFDDDGTVNFAFTCA